MTGNNTAGVITLGGGSPTACTLVYATSTPYVNPPYQNPPIVVANSNGAGYVEITADNTTSTTFTLSTTETKIYYYAFGY